MRDLVVEEDLSDDGFVDEIRAASIPVSCCLGREGEGAARREGGSADEEQQRGEGQGRYETAHGSPGRDA